jgi:hypothetical protein
MFLQAVLTRRPQRNYPRPSTPCLLGTKGPKYVSYFSRTTIGLYHLRRIGFVAANGGGEDGTWFTRSFQNPRIACLSLYFVHRTLQELLAPNNVRFYDHGLRSIGSKMDLVDEIAAITGIPRSLLNGTRELQDFSIAQRMSWASGRETTREGASLREEALITDVC